MAVEFSILTKNIADIGTIVDAMPQSSFTLDSGLTESLSILERRCSPGMLKEALCDYNRIFSKNMSVTIDDICCAATAYLKIRVLAERNEEDINVYSKEALYITFENTVSKTQNLINLLNVQKSSVAGSLVEELDRRIEKYKALIEAYENEIEKLDLLDFEKEEEAGFVEQAEEVIPEKACEDVKPMENFDTKLEEKLISEVAEEIDIEPLDPLKPEALKEEVHIAVKEELQEKRVKASVPVSAPLREKSPIVSLQRPSICGERRCSMKMLTVDEYYICKDIAGAVLMRNRKNLYFGWQDHLVGNKYNNADGSLYLLSGVDRDFIQFMTMDLLDGEFELRPLSVDEANGLSQYFSFMNVVAKDMLGSVKWQEFLHYYNCLVQTIWEIEKDERVARARANILCDTYISYLNGFCFPLKDSRELIVRNLINHESLKYVADLQAILDEYVYEPAQREPLIRLMDEMV